MSSGVCCILLVLGPILLTSGYDGYSSCSRPYRTSKSRLEPPCNFQRQSWCTVPGSAYPWHAVRRFVQENHGLMRRMYGDQRHISVLRAEIESNDVEYLGDGEWRHRETIRTNYGNKISNTEPTVTKEISSPTTMTAATTIESIPREVLITMDSDPSSSTNVQDSNNTLYSDALNGTTGTIPYYTPSPQTLETPTQPTSSHIPTTISSPGLKTSDLVTITIPDPTPNEIGSSTLTSDPSTTVEQMETVTQTIAVTEPTTIQDGLTTTLQEDEEDADDSDVEDQEQEESAPVEAQLFQDVRAKDRAPATPMLRLRGVNACPVKEEVVAPFWANNTRGEVLALLNLYPFEQYVHWEKCTFELKQMYCREGCRCEQQYRLHRLLAYDPNNECRGIFSDWFKFPSCCVCRCYDLPVEFQMTSRSPRTRPASSGHNMPSHWYKVANNR